MNAGHLISHILQLHRGASVGLHRLLIATLICSLKFSELWRALGMSLADWNGTLIDSKLFPNVGCIFHIDFDNNGCPFLLGSTGLAQYQTNICMLWISKNIVILSEHNEPACGAANGWVPLSVLRNVRQYCNAYNSASVMSIQTQRQPPGHLSVAQPNESSKMIAQSKVFVYFYPGDGIFIIPRENPRQGPRCMRCQRSRVMLKAPHSTL